MRFFFSRAKLVCGHPSSLIVYSAATDEPLYCELCDIRSQRNDAVQMEAHYRERAEKAEAALAAEHAKVERLREAIERAAHKLETARIWGGMKYEWGPAHPVVVQPTHAILRAALEAER